jgi:hypothetical protein
MTMNDQGTSGTTGLSRITGEWTIVWIDAREAIIVGWRDNGTFIERFESEVPVHHSATGHVRHDPMIRHGGTGREQTAGDPHRLEHLARFLDQVAGKLPERGGIAILGSGDVHERLARLLHEADERHGRVRLVTATASRRLTRPQLAARLRELRGEAPRRRTVGAYRWTGAQKHTASGTTKPPRHVVQKPPKAQKGE